MFLEQWLFSYPLFSSSSGVEKQFEWLKVMIFKPEAPMDFAEQNVTFRKYTSLMK